MRIDCVHMAQQVIRFEVNTDKHRCYGRFSQGILIDFLVGSRQICAKLTSLQLTTLRRCGYFAPLVVLYTTREYSKMHNVADTARYLAKLQSTAAAKQVITPK